MKRKPMRNKFRDMVGDYYKTNRQISKEESQREGYKGPINSKEKAMVIVVVLLVVILVIKSCFLDEVKNLSPQEAQFKDYVEYAIEQDLQKDNQFNFITYRVYDIFLADKDQQVELNYVNPETEKEVSVIQDGRYSARVRGYFLWVIPVKHFSMTAQEKQDTETKPSTDKEKE